MIALRIVLLVFALVSVYMVYRVGDLGAKAVWAGRLQQSSLPGGPLGPNSNQ